MSRGARPGWSRVLDSNGRGEEDASGCLFQAIGCIVPLTPHPFHQAKAIMEQPQVVPPSAEELQAFSLGKCEAHRAVQIEAFLSDGPDCRSILDAAPEDVLVRHLRGAGELPVQEGPSRSAETLPHCVETPARADTPCSGPISGSQADLAADAAPLLD